MFIAVVSHRNRRVINIFFRLMSYHHFCVCVITDNNASTTSNSNCGATTNMNKRHHDDSSIMPGNSARIALSRSCSSPAVSHGKSTYYSYKYDVNLWNFGWFKSNKRAWISNFHVNNVETYIERGKYLKDYFATCCW